MKFIKSSKPVKLNLGCGENKLEGYVNIDMEASVKPDRILDFVNKPLPFPARCADEVVLFHTIEHIQKRFHRKLFLELNRVLRRGGILLVSYPEFEKCVDNWKRNHLGMRTFWEATVFGRQLFPSDYHVCAMHTPEFSLLLQECGFKEIESYCEPTETHNTVVAAVSGQPYKNYEDLCRDDMAATKVQQNGSVHRAVLSGKAK